jgi:hypothetical protein
MPIGMFKQTRKNCNWMGHVASGISWWHLVDKNTYTTRNKTDARLVTSKGTNTKVNAEITKYTTGRSQLMPGLHSWKKKSHKNKNQADRVQNSHLNQCFSWGLGDLWPHPIQCMTIPLVHIWNFRVYTYDMYSIHCCIIYIFLMQSKCKIHPQFLVPFIPTGLWYSCYTNTYVPD